MPVQPPPLQPAKVEPLAATAVKLTGSLTIKVLAHWLLLGLQLMPDGLLVTWPLPLPAWAMVSVKVLTRPILLPRNSVNHSVRSGPAVMALGSLLAVVTAYSAMPPEVLIRPILLVLNSANHRFPSGPAAMPRGPLLAVGMVNSVNAPAVVIRPILLPPASA